MLLKGVEITVRGGGKRKKTLPYFHTHSDKLSGLFLFKAVLNLKWTIL